LRHEIDRLVRIIVAQQAVPTRLRQHVSEWLPCRFVFPLNFVIEPNFAATDHRLKLVPIQRTKIHSAHPDNPAAQVWSKSFRFGSELGRRRVRRAITVAGQSKTEQSDAQFVNRCERSADSRIIAMLGTDLSISKSVDDYSKETPFNTAPS